MGDSDEPPLAGWFSVAIFESQDDLYGSGSEFEGLETGVGGSDEFVTYEAMLHSEYY